MIEVVCACGARGVAPNTLAGRTVRCRKCRGPIDVPPAPDPLRNYTGSTIAERRAAERLRRRRQSFWLDLLASPTLLSLDLDNFVRAAIAIAMLVGAWLAFELGRSGGAGGTRGDEIISIVLASLFVGFGLEVISYTAGGDDELPSPTDFDNLNSEILQAPAEAWTATFVVCLPAFVYMGLQWWPHGFFTFTADPLLIGLGALALLLWPATMLAVALNSVHALARPDLIVRTMFAAPAAYLAVCVMIAGTIAVVVASALAPGTIGLGFAGRLGVAALGGYAFIVVMRCLGLYYRHYSDRFPWSAG